jgi:hypothetical protein
MKMGHIIHIMYIIKKYMFITLGFDCVHAGFVLIPGGQTEAKIYNTSSCY